MGLFGEFKILLRISMNMPYKIALHNGEIFAYRNIYKLWSSLDEQTFNYHFELNFSVKIVKLTSTLRPTANISPARAYCLKQSGHIV